MYNKSMMLSYGVRTIFNSISITATSVGVFSVNIDLYIMSKRFSRLETLFRLSNPLFQAIDALLESRDLTSKFLDVVFRGDIFKNSE